MSPMPRITRLTSPDNPRLKRARRLRNQRDRRQTGLMLAEGRREVTRALHAGLTFEAFFYCPPCLKRHHLAPEPELLAALPHQTPCFELARPLMEKIAQLRDPQGLLAIVHQPDWRLENLPAVREDSLYLVPVGIEKPGNLGAMVRTAEAAGCDAVLAADTVVDPFNPHAIRNSTAAVFTLPTIPLDRHALTAFCRERRVRLAAATLQQATPYTQVEMTGPLAIAIGPEDTGLSRAWYQAAEQTRGPRVSIPLRGQTVDSLNAAAAAAVLLFEAQRQQASAKDQHGPEH